MQKKTLKKVFRYLRPYGWMIGLSLLLAVVTVVLTLYIPILTGRAVDLIVAPGKVDFAALAPVLARAAVAAGITALAQWLMNLLNNRITLCTVRDIRHAAFRKIQILPVVLLNVALMDFLLESANLFLINWIPALHKQYSLLVP